MLAEQRQRAHESGGITNTTTNTANIALVPPLHPKLVSELALVAGAIENPDSLRQLVDLAKTLSRP